MSGRYLIDMADVLRAAGCHVIEQANWQTRARSSGGYGSGYPLCVMWHHTASGANASAKSDTDYMSYNADARPIANIMVARNGDVWVLAAGATNTNGSGDSRKFSRGTVPADGMNTRTIGIEIQNTGVGQAYSQECIDATFKASNALNQAYGNQPTDVDMHWLYAVGRKIDPATANAVQGPWRPTSMNSSGSWDLVDLRSECSARSHQAPTPPTPIPGEDDTMQGIFENQQTPKQFNAMFFGTCDAQGRTIELQWSGDGDDPRVRERIETMKANFKTFPLELGGVKNNRLHPKHRPEDINDSLHRWVDSDFAP